MNKAKKKKIGFKIIKNNFFLLGYAFKKSPGYIILSLIHSVLEFIVVFFEHPYAIIVITDAIQYQKSFSTVLHYAAFTVIMVSAWLFFGTFCWTYLFNISKEKLFKAVQLDMFQKSSEIDLECYDNPDYYNEYVWSLNTMTTQIEKVIVIFQNIARGITRLILGGYIFIRFDKIGIIFALIAAILSLTVSIKQNKIAFKLNVKVASFAREREYVSRLFYQHEYAKELRMHDIKDKFKNQFDNANESIISETKAYSKKQILLTVLEKYVFNTFIIQGVYLVYLLYSAIISKTISYGAVFVLYRIVIWYFSGGIYDLASVVPDFTSTSLYIDKIRHFLNNKPKIKSDTNTPLPKEPAAIRLTDVSFSYEGNESFSLKNISMEIKPCEKVAIVGYNGAGKTTLVKLLTRLYDVTEGKIEIGEKNVKDYNLKDLRDNFGVLFQDYQLIASSVKENVSMDIESDDILIKKSLAKSGFTQKLESMEKKEETNITKEFDDDGAVLSGGEAQKLAIARVLYKNSNYIIMDEPSSALDPVSEYNINKIIIEEAKTKTVIFISHRLSATKNADKIYMFENGEIIEHGTHEDLMSLNGKYSEMFTLQADKYKIIS